MALNLSRNTKVYFTTNVDATTGSVTDGNAGYSTSNLFEIQVLDGYSFTQNTETQQITVTEGGISPLRGSRTFNTALAPVDFSFSTYLRPDKPNATSATTAVERVLWNALFGSRALNTTGVTLSKITRANNTTGDVTLYLGANVTVSSGDMIGAVLPGLGGGTASKDWSQAYRVTQAFTADTGTATFSAEAMIAPLTASATAAVAGLAYTGQWATGVTDAGGFSYTTTVGSQKHQLQRFGMIFVVDSAIYAIDNCCLTQASVDFGLDQLATIAWTGQGTTLKRLGTLTAANLSAAAASGPSSTAKYIANKLSTMSLVSKIGGPDGNTGTTSYNVAITGGNITINNNVTYLTPANLGVVNAPVTYFTGTRDISGNVTAYLKTGTDDATGTGDLLAALLASSTTDTEPKYRAVLALGGSSNTVKVEFDMPGTMLQIPTVEVQDVVSTTINFRAQPFDPAGGSNTFALNRSNELAVRYFSAP